MAIKTIDIRDSFEPVTLEIKITGVKRLRFQLWLFKYTIRFFRWWIGFRLVELEMVNDA